MPFRIRSSPAGYPIRPPITAEELGATIDFPTHLADNIAHNLLSRDILYWMGAI